MIQSDYTKTCRFFRSTSQKTCQNNHNKSVKTFAFFWKKTKNLDLKKGNIFLVPLNKRPSKFWKAYKR